MRQLFRRPLIATLAPTFALVLASAALAQSAQPQLGWSGWARCDVAVRGSGYSDQQTHTWTMGGGAPTVQGAFYVYPGTWSVSGGGTLQQSQGAQSLTAQWSTNVSATSAPLAVFVRASDGMMFIQTRHAQLRSAGAVQGYQQQTVSGKALPRVRIGAEAFEWTFPTIQLPARSNSVSSSSSSPTTGKVGLMQPAGTPGTASCTWQFGKGTAAPAPPAASH